MVVVVGQSEGWVLRVWFGALVLCCCPVGFRASVGFRSSFLVFIVIVISLFASHLTPYHFVSMLILMHT
jgi:hypothetical protein